MRGQMASITSGVPAVAGAGGGMFNRMGGGGNITSAGASGGGFGSGGFRPFAFDQEAEQVRGGLRTLARALYGQAMAVGQMTGSLRSGVVTGAPIGSAGQAAAAAGDDSSSGLLKGFGRRFAAMFAIHSIVQAIGAAQTQMVSNEGLDRKLNLGDFGGAIEEQLGEAKQLRGGTGGLWRKWGLPILGAVVNPWFGWGLGKKANAWFHADDETAQHELEDAQLIHRGNTMQDQGREHIRQMRMHNELYGLGAFNAAQVQAKHAIEDAAHNAQPLKSLAKLLSTISPIAAKGLLNQAGEIEGQGAISASGIRRVARRNANTIGMGLQFDVEEEQLRGSFQPKRAEVLSIYAATAMRVREMLISSTPANAQLARQLGIAQEESYKAHLIMSGHGSVGNPFAEAMGPQAGQGIETLTDILKAIQDIADKLSNLSLGDLAGLSANPLDN